MTQPHDDGMLAECEVRFNQQDKTASQVVKQLEKLNERVGTLLTDSAVMRESVNNHQKSLQDNMLQQETRFQDELKAQETRSQIAVGRLWKVLIALLLGVGVGGGGAAVNQWVF